MLSVEQLIEEAQDPRLRKQPLWVQTLVGDMAHRLRLESTAAANSQARAEVEVSAAREALAEGPADSDTFLDLPRSLADTDDVPQKPLGKGVNIEFRPYWLESGEGINVKLDENGSLHVRGIGHLVVVPVDQSYVKIKEG